MQFKFLARYRETRRRRNHKIANESTKKLPVTSDSRSAGNLFENGDSERSIEETENKSFPINCPFLAERKTEASKRAAEEQDVSRS